MTYLSGSLSQEFLFSSAAKVSIYPSCVQGASLRIVARIAILTPVCITSTDEMNHRTGLSHIGAIGEVEVVGFLHHGTSF